MTHDALKRAFDKAERNQSAFAAAIGTSQQRISYLIRKERPCPADLVLKIEAAYGVSRHELRPDLYPVPESAAA
jgi:DNA-binding transcriptional regulator YdaS (Cro superfamily)